MRNEWQLNEAGNPVRLWVIRWIYVDRLKQGNGKYLNEILLIPAQIGLDQRANFSEDTRILYCTTGVLLERLIQLHDFGQFTHIILDEVHERSKEIDFLLIVIKKLLAKATTKPNVKFIFMSATFDVDAVSLGKSIWFDGF